MRCTVSAGMPVYKDVRDLLYSFHKGFFYPVKFLNLSVKITVYDFNCLSETCNGRHIFRTGTETVLLSAAKEDGFYFHFFIYI